MLDNSLHILSGHIMLSSAQRMNRKWRTSFRIALYSAQRWWDRERKKWISGPQPSVTVAFTFLQKPLRAETLSWMLNTSLGVPHCRLDNKNQPPSGGQRNGVRRAALKNWVEDAGGSAATSSSVLLCCNCCLYPQSLWKMICKQYDLFRNPILHSVWWQSCKERFMNRNDKYTEL